MNELCAVYTRRDDGTYTLLSLTTSTRRPPSTEVGAEVVVTVNSPASAKDTLTGAEVGRAITLHRNGPPKEEFFVR